ncbi:MAG: DUF1214 domain-containing protein [Myxococcales bacterium]|nr:MAG: DUF1214 domain-containing protein [Myxococcales bacterium]
MSSDGEGIATGRAWHEWCDRLKAVGDRILGEEFPQAPRDRAEGFRWLTRLVAHAAQMEIEAGDPMFPRFVRYETPAQQWGGPNPDNTYYRANIDPGQSYRVWAAVTGVRQLIVSLHEGDMQLGELGVYGEHTLDQLVVGSDWRLEIVVAAEKPAQADSLPVPSWIPMHASARMLTIRIYQSDWERDAAPPFHIERIGAEGLAPPPLEPAALERALERSATWVEKTATFWNTYTSAAWERSMPNVASSPRPVPGGADNILYGSCCWELGEDQALLLECEQPDAQYWGFTIHTLGWLESGDFAERQTSLSDRQAFVDNDGRVRIVLSHRDPGTANWIDTEQRQRGMLVYRWVWASSNPVPTASLIGVDDVRAALPRDHPTVDTDARRRALARRREAAWNRFL